MLLGLNIFYAEEKGLGVAYNSTMPSPEEVFTKEPNHTHTHTLPRTGCLIISTVTITRQYDSQVNITNYNLSVLSINLCTASKTFYIFQYLDLLIRTVTTHTRYLS